MYLILNTAMSGTWGFPAPMPAGCKCKSYECGDPACECALPAGFCDNFPASFLVDSVRVYQAEGHVLACSTREKPSSVFIEGHKERYMNADFPDGPLLREQVVGGGACARHDECGHGVCSASAGLCDCTEGGGTGPFCRAWVGAYDANVYQELGREEKLVVQGVYVSWGLIAMFAAGAGVLAWQCVRGARLRREKMEGYAYVNTYGGTFSTDGNAYGSGTPAKVGQGLGAAESQSPSHPSYYQRGPGNVV